MALKKIHEIPVGERSAVRIYRDADLDEYIVKSIVDGKVQGGKGGGYFTSDKTDAYGTASAEADRLRKKPHNGRQHHAVRQKKKSSTELDRDIAETLATRSHSTKQTYRNFTVITYPEGHRGSSKLRWYRSPSPVAWDVARDRLIKAGVLDPDLAGRTSSAGGWMLSVDPSSYSEDRAKPLPK